jgi:hypothetical protein
MVGISEIEEVFEQIKFEADIVMISLKFNGRI